MYTSTFKSKLRNLLSRKFLVAVAGIITGTTTIMQGQTVAGASLIAVAIISYLIAEGYVDAKSVAEAASDASTVVKAVAEVTDNKTIDQIADTVEKVNDSLNPE